MPPRRSSADRWTLLTFPVGSEAIEQINAQCGSPRREIAEAIMKGERHA
ncbi:MAG: hypothetical protein ABSC37_06490 [Xanthobacteraceae bacterium]|jgi:hypothetical protein